MSTAKSNPAVEALKGAVKGKIVFDGEKATLDKEFVVQNLPEGLTQEQFEASFAHLDNVIHATASVGGVEGIDHLKKNKDLERVVIKIPVTGRSYVEHSLQRTKEIPALGGAEAKTIHGHLQSKVSIYSTKNRGAMTAIKDELAALAAKKLAS